MKRVLFLDHVDRVLGGAEINLIELLGATRGREHWEIACACRAGGQLSERLKGIGIRCFDYGLGAGLNQLRFTGRVFPWAKSFAGMKALGEAAESLRKIVREFKPEILISCTNKDHFASVKACAGTQTRTVWWVNDLVTKDFFAWPARIVFRKYAAAADRLVAVSECVRGALLRLGIPAEKIRTIYNGIPLEKYRATEERAFRRRIGLPLDEPLFGTIGRFCEWKGQDLFLEMARRWIARERPGRFVLAGQAFNEDQSFENDLKKFTHKHGLEERVHFVPFQENVAEVLTDLDVLVHSARRPEPFGRILVEAMAVGAPVIAANAGGAREIIQHGKNGLLARPADVEDYVTKLREAWPATAATRQMTQQARQTVAERFTLDRTLSEFEKLLAEIY